MQPEENDDFSEIYVLLLTIIVKLRCQSPRVNKNCHTMNGCFGETEKCRVKTPEGL